MMEIIIGTLEIAEHTERMVNIFIFLCSCTERQLFIRYAIFIKIVLYDSASLCEQLSCLGQDRQININTILAELISFAINGHFTRLSRSLNVNLKIEFIIIDIHLFQNYHIPSERNALRNILDNIQDETCSEFVSEQKFL